MGKCCLFSLVSLFFLNFFPFSVCYMDNLILMCTPHFFPFNLFILSWCFIPHYSFIRSLIWLLMLSRGYDIARESLPDTITSCTFHPISEVSHSHSFELASLLLYWVMLITGINLSATYIYASTFVFTIL